MLWALGAAAGDLGGRFFYQVFWVKFQTVWQLPAATAIICFVLVYAGLGRWLTRRNLDPAGYSSTSSPGLDHYQRLSSPDVDRIPDGWIHPSVSGQSKPDLHRLCLYFSFS